MDRQPATVESGGTEPSSDTSTPRNNGGHASANIRRTRDSSAARGDIKTPRQPSNNSSNISQQSTSSVLTTSPQTSRETSPTRPPMRKGSAAKSAGAAASTGTGTVNENGTRSRKNSQSHDPSPTRNARPSMFSSATNLRTLSAANTPVLLPAGGGDSVIKAPVPQKPPFPGDPTRDPPRWPVSPRLRSPPPILNKPSLGPPRKGDQNAPTINFQRSTPSPQPNSDHPASDTDQDDLHNQSPGTRTPIRGPSTGNTTLETVQEASPLATPRGLDDVLEKLERGAAYEEISQTSTGDGSIAGAMPSKTSNGTPNESGSDSGSGSNKPGRRSTAQAAPPTLTARQSSASIKPSGTKSKPSEPSAQSMTVETETVTSIPQVLLAPKTDPQNPNGTLRAKPSTETIRPKKEKKKPSRKQLAVNSGTASSKADIFEAKVASAVDEANTSDSDETFVYDSNPPDAGDRPRRFHSRTPSATSMASQVDRNGMRSIHTVMDGAPGPSALAVKKSMKFVNTYNGSGNDSGLGDDESKGVGRNNVGSARGTARHHHHFGRWGRNGGNGHPSLFDNDTFFPVNAARSKLAGAQNSRQPSGPPSPRPGNGRPAQNGKRGLHLGSYDLDDATGADDERNERTPLLDVSVRSGRSTRRGRPPMSLRSLEQQGYHQHPSFLNRFASCLVLTVMLLLVVSGAIGFIFLTTQPLTEIKLVGIKNVVPSEQELMMDLVVRAHNPNLVVVVIDSADLEIFAKSPHAGSDSEWWKRPHDKPGSMGPFEARRARAGHSVQVLDDPANDPPADDSSPIMRLGSIREFDSPLSFEGSFFHQGISASPGAVRLQMPGNGTERGTERWERILDDEFELILKGVLKYTLPLSQRVRSVPISGKTTVKPHQVGDPSLRPNSTTT